MNGTNAAIEQQYVFTDSEYGAVYAEGKGVLTDNNINMTLTFTCSAGSFGEKQEILDFQRNSTITTMGYSMNMYPLFISF